MKGILLVDKPSGMTSHDVVDYIRKAAGLRRVGHTGTLDPAATGLLILCLGTATRLSEHLTGLDKRYEGDMRLGTVTDSYDMDGKVLETNPVPDLEPAELQKRFDALTGDIMQVPPMVSAVKVGGERLYKKARKGETVDRPARPVTVREFTLLGYESPLARFDICCTRGTYVRALCHDIGQTLGCGAVLNSLRRTAVGKHHVDNALPLESLRTRRDVQEHLMPPGEALELPAVIPRRAGERMIASGSPLRDRDLKSPCPVSSGWVQLKTEDGDLLALAQVEEGPGELYLQPRRVFMNTEKRTR